MEVNLFTVGIVASTGISMFYYWATAKNRWLGVAYSLAISNGFLLVWINWVFAAPGRVPNFSFWEIGMSNDTSAANFFNILCAWIIFSGVRGLRRLRHEDG